MQFARKASSCAAATAALLAVLSSQALAGTPGGTAAPAGPQAGGSEFASSSRVPQARPVVGELLVPRAAPAGRPPRVALRIDEPGAGSVAARVTVTDLATRRNVLVVPLGWIRTGRTVIVHWPRGAALRAGSYHVSLAANDRRGTALLRRAHSSGVANLTVLAPAPKIPPPPPPVTPSPTTPEGLPTPAQTAASGAVFPVAGAHSFGGPEGRFGAPRGNHTHQGQDVLAAEGIPVVFPLAGTVVTTSYQAAGGGYYAVEHTPTFDFMFAHCQAGSLAVSSGEAVSAGQVVCNVGRTGDATTPHLHFEMWVGGWHGQGGQPIDPLPYLEAW